MMLDSVTEYALSFSGEAVHLQSRQKPVAGHDGQRPPAWRHLGSVDFDDPQFRDGLSELRQMATGSDDDADLPVTLIIPDDQILYTTLTVAPSADREHAVGRALDGLTPYAIEDLAFDWEGDGDSVRVAAAARQTLREAREFAAQYGFQGIGYCAEPQDDQFPGEPLFVLEAPSRVRAPVDPAVASVTAAALMIEDEPSDSIAATDSGNGNESDGTPAIPDASGAAEDFELPADAPVEPQREPEMAEESPAAADTDDDKALALSSELVDPVTGDAVSPTSESIDAEFKAAELAPAAPEPELAVAAQPETPAPGILPEAAAESAVEPAVDVAAALKVPPVVRHAPARPDAPRAPLPEARPEPLNPRARALHDRAAEARQDRAAGGGAAPAAPVRVVSNHRGGLVGLLAMLGVLVVGLVLIWAFAVPDEKPVQIVATTEPAPVAAQSNAPQAAVVASNDVSTQTNAATPAPAPQTGDTAAAPQPAPGATESETGAPEADDPEAPVAQIRAAPAPISALTEDEQRRVVIAAAAVAAAVVPPHNAAVRQAAPQPTAKAIAPQVAAQVARPAIATTPANRPAPATTTATTAAVPRPTTATPGAARPAVAAAVPDRATPRLTSSARPQLSPRRSTPQTSTPREDAAPRLPSNPLPYAASQRSRPADSARPPARGRSQSAQANATPAATPVVTPAAASTRGSARPPQRPEGSAPDLIEGDSAALEPADQAQLAALVHDLNRHGLALPGGDKADIPDVDAQLAQARPQRKPGHGSTASDAISPSAVEAALKSATNAPPDKSANTRTSASPARDSGGLLRGSSRPLARPLAAGAVAGAVSETAVESAVAAAVNASAASPGGVRLSTLRSSSPPPRRSEDAPATPAAKADPPPGPAEGPGPTVAAAAAASPSAAEISARRALDEQLQAQAEARIRARAQADAAAEAQARAQAEARARAQAAAEERAARTNRQVYKPPEVDDEPEVAANVARGGTTAANVAKSATQSRGIDMGRTTIIGIIGAGQASRALIRLRNGKIVTVRLGDRIDGGTINSIGDGRLTYVKSGQVRELRMLDGR